MQEARLEKRVIGHSERQMIGVGLITESNVAAALPYHDITDPFKNSDRLTARNDRQFGIHSATATLLMSVLDMSSTG